MGMTINLLVLAGCAKIPQPTALPCESAVFIPGGEVVFDDYDGSPPKTVQVAPFWISRTEVTMGWYTACEAAGACTDWGEGGYEGGFEPFPDGASPEKANNPIWTVSWKDAVKFATWVGGQLPSEAQWERAAWVGGQLPWNAPWEYPAQWNQAPRLWSPYCWDGSKPDENKACTPTTTAPVCSRAKRGDRLCDMEGNLAEWTADLYHPHHHYTPEDGSPTAVDNDYLNYSRDPHVVIGGSWARNRWRNWSDSPAFIGFRVVWNKTPVCATTNKEQPSPR